MVPYEYSVQKKTKDRNLVVFFGWHPCIDGALFYMMNVEYTVGKLAQKVTIFCRIRPGHTGVMVLKINLK